MTLVTDLNACAAQEMTNRFRFFEGEWFLDTRQGFPYFRFLTVKNPDVRALKQLFTKVALSVQGVKSVKSMLVKITPQRQCVVNLVAVTDSGATITGGEGNAFVVSH